MKNKLYVIFVFILAITLLNCSKNKESDDLAINPKICEQITNTTNFHLYYFQPFTEYERKNMSLDDRLKKRQLPEEVLKLSTLEELFNNCMWWDLAPDILLFNSYQLGFRVAYFNRFNGIQELYKREGVHLFLEEKLRMIDTKDMVTMKCGFYNHLLEFIYVQNECLSHYPADEIKNVLSFMFEKADRLSYLTTVDSTNYSTLSLSQWMLGIGNILIMYKYKPFLDELDKDLELKSFFEGRINAKTNVIIKISDFGTTFYNDLKN